MLNLKKIAVTGGLSAGKSTVCQLFKDLGAYVISADTIVHQLLSLGTTTAEQVIALLGPEIIAGDTIDRNKIATKVFSEPNLLDALEKILHPAVFDEIERRYKQASKERKYSLFVAEIPLLYEAEKETHFDQVISVEADESLCRNRSPQHTPEEFDRRMKRQLAPQIKTAKSHYAIKNNGTLEDLKKQVKTLYTQLTQE